MLCTESVTEWVADGKPVQIGLSRYGSGPEMLLLPALSSISTRDELRGLQMCLGKHYSTLSVDWPGFGTLPRPEVAWRPEHYRHFLRYLTRNVTQPEVTVACGHAAGYLLAQAAESPGSVGSLCLLSPTWRGPLPTMLKRRPDFLRRLPGLTDLPGIGAVFYRLNVNSQLIRMMGRGHVYENPQWLTETRLAGKLRVTEAPGARHASFRFVTGALDLFTDRGCFLDTMKHISRPVLVVTGRYTPEKSREEMDALCALPGVVSSELPGGKLSFYEECPEETAGVILRFLVPECPAE
ncbi:alpha/beta fold hydrolase [Salmonella enterica]|uniref:Alpha/beta hydrolase n=1 Tax=Salmonella enterica I TaxID=59201 RepID=A0A3R1B046_SALET|nr:alpha/beta fold hydrolase [Salmonella enterica]MML56793.1 alpha/beta hydrolase [Salmonella enterica subsp. enterica serovar Kidderminster]